IRTDHQRLGVLWVSAREFDKTSGPIRLGEFAGVPTGRTAALARQKPDLEELQRVLLAVMLGMTDAGPGAHDLDVAGDGPADVAGTVLVRDGALADISHDLHVRVRVAAKSGAGRDLVVIPDHESAEWAILGIAVGRNDEVVTRLQPATIAVIERFLGSKLQHDHS